MSSGYSPLPANLTYTLTDPAGRVLYSGIAGQSRPGSPAVRVHFDDVDNDTRVSAQDHVRVTIFPVTPNELAGGRLQLFYDGEKAGECPLP